MEELKFELANAWSGLKASPVLSFLAVVAMALGIGATTFIYVGGQNYLTSLPVDEPDRFVHLGFIDKNNQSRQRDATVEEYLEFSEQLNNVDASGAFLAKDLIIGGAESSRRFKGAEVTASVFEMLAVKPLLGRVIAEQDMQAGAEPVVVLGYDLWRDFYERRSDLIGRKIRINQTLHTVIGVTKKNFKYPRNQQLWIPLNTHFNGLTGRNETPSVDIIATLKAGATIASLQHESRALVSNMQARYPKTYENFTAYVQPYTIEFIGDHIPTVVYTLFLASVMVLGIACANIANLFLALGNKRSLELAVQSALGAPRRRLIIRFLLESSIVCISGGIIGFGIGLYISQAVGEMIVSNDPSVPFWIAEKMSQGISFGLDDLHQLWFALVALVFSTLVAGAVPAVKMSKPDINSALKANATAVSGGAKNKFISALIIGEIMFSCALLVGAVFLVQSSMTLKNKASGFDEQGVLTTMVSLTGDQFAEDEGKARVYRELSVRLRDEAEIAAFSFSSVRPGAAAPLYYYSEFGETYDKDADHPIAKRIHIGEGFDSALGITLTQGRMFNDTDHLNSQPVAIVSQSLAEKLAPGGNVVGQQVRVGVDDSRPWRTIVGVMPYLNFQGDLGRSRRTEIIYEPIAQSPVGGVVILTRGRGGKNTAPVVEKLVSQQDRDISINLQRTVTRWQEISQFYFHLQSQIMIGFAFIALFLSLIGIVGILFFTISQQRREFGIRKALGAKKFDIILFIQKRLMIQVGLGVVAGLGLAVVLVRGLQSQLVGINPNNVWVYLGVSISLALFIVIAAMIPAKQAADIHPDEALRDS